MLESVWYGFDHKNPAGVDNGTVLLGNHKAAYLVASEGNLLAANLSYDFPFVLVSISQLKNGDLENKVK